MKALLDHMIEMELSTKERQKKIYFADTLEEVTALLNLKWRMVNGYVHFPFSIFNLDTVLSLIHICNGDSTPAQAPAQQAAPKPERCV